MEHIKSTVRSKRLKNAGRQGKPRRRWATSLLLLAVLIATAEGRPNSAQAPSREGGGTRFEATHVVLAETLQSKNAPGGIVFVSRCNANPKFNFHVNGDLQLEAALREIVQTDGTFQWRMEDGVVYAAPAASVPDMLGTHISEYAFRKHEPLEAAVNRLLMKGEVARRAEQLGLGRAVVRLGMQAVSRHGPVDKSNESPIMTIRQVKLYEALNAIVRSHGRGVWLYQEDECHGSRTFGVSIVAK